jgi:[acyl-carrier-protein] S-malonyltransferase
MGKVAFIFPGQGSQYAGMGKEVHDTFACARSVFADADDALGLSLSGLCFNGPDDLLKLTENTQPAILTASVAILRVLEERRFRADYVAGHSLGEYSALVCAGAITLRDAVRVVRMRGRYMQEAVPPGMGAMAAVIGLDASQVSEACREAAAWGVVSPANFNSPDQIVIAGEARAVQSASEKMKELGAKRVIPLPVSAPFHCGLMAPARDRLQADLRAVDFRDLAVPLVSNVDAAEVLQGEAARDGLVRQVCSPVRWVESVRYLADCGVDRFIEIGPGKVLTGLVKKIAPQAQASSVEGIRGIEALASAFPGATM